MAYRLLNRLLLFRWVQCSMPASVAYWDSRTTTTFLIAFSDSGTGEARGKKPCSTI
ncbi:MAG TPA: hypothetical protein PKL24_24170 [Polyangiaceae bacterium]|jgi:transcription initiation factor TFIID subunit TAF12|nr:hypothetical protein [Polyangiaceae bacterium]HOE50856.1 hypothetical protein [Polyangiaceae bacterium]HOH03361.1 hypothetical protein [Polyangiaceae bacterium]HOR37929.1 hypothetical protein [Polyangiaceae bacterium]HPK95902.1 hypothetical protein [Polyangiaceae bacterium]